MGGPEPAGAEGSPVTSSVTAGPGPLSPGGTKTEWPTGIVLAVLLVLLGAAVGVGLRPDPAPATTAGRFAAADGFRGFTTFTAGSEHAAAMVENARSTGPQTDSSVPQGLWASIDRRPATAGTTAHWWREGVVVTGFSRPAQRYRLRSIGGDGVRLAGQEWGTDGIALSPALLELPADVSAGRQWGSHGRALAGPTGDLLGYTNTSTAGRPQAAAEADDGCLEVHSATTLSPLTPAGEPSADPTSGPTGSTGTGDTTTGGATAGDATAGSTWTETNLWCPGRGVVASDGNFRGTGFDFGTLSPSPTPDLSDAALTEAGPLTGDPSSWRSGPLRLEGGDDTFGSRDGRIDTAARLIARDGTGALHVVNGGGQDVNTLTPLATHRLWAHGWLHPGGSVTGVADVGRLVLVTTSERRLRCYDYAGRLHWSAELPDLSVTSPVAPTRGVLVVTTVRGDVLGYDTRTGALRWRQHLSISVDAPTAVGNTVVVVGGTDGSLTAFDADGSRLWQQEAGTVSPATVIVRDAAVSITYGQLQARDLRTGALRWTRTGLGATDALRVLAGSPAILDAGGVRSFSVADGTLRWNHRVAGVTDAVSLDDTGDRAGSLVLGEDAVVALSSTGRETARWALATPLGDSGRLFLGSGQVWALGAPEQTLAGTWIGPRAPGPS